jgi:hypothetical protein
MSFLPNFLAGLLLIGSSLTLAAQPINRQAVVERHQVRNTTTDSLASLTVGNGGFAFTADVTGLQTFPEYYQKGVPLGTQSEWGWHSFPNPESYKVEEAQKSYTLNGRQVSYTVQGKGTDRTKAAVDFLRANPHRLQLGNLGFVLLKKDGRRATIKDLRDLKQTLNPWTGEISSHFTLEGVPVDVLTVGHQEQDAVAVRVQSPLLKQQRLQLALRFPYPTAQWDDVGVNYSQPDKHTSTITEQKSGAALIAHQLDKDEYFVALGWAGEAKVSPAGKHEFVVVPGGKSDAFELSCRFSPRTTDRAAAFAATRANSQARWKAYWLSGGAVDFAGTADPRASELERRVVLSQYLIRAQTTGAFPPQETGLTYNSWFGKPHLEMHWWHSMHHALWGRIDLLEKSLDWYTRPEIVAGAKAIARRQGWEGLRWQKMTDNEGREAPSSVGAFLIWQQPHFIHMAELVYRAKQTKAVQQKYQELVFATADFMASYPFYEKDKDRYILGKGLIPAQERFKAEETFNPTYELVYWHWALTTAQEWRKRAGLAPNPKWDAVLQKLSKLPEANGVYLAAESAPDSYTNPEFKTDHPSVLGALGMMPATGQQDPATMRRTFDLVWNDWSWNKTWGWDFPMTSMTATRLGLPDKAVEALLMKVPTNTYLPNGHNFQDDRLRLYLPGNGGLLAAVALMCAGYDGSPANPGIPATWKVKWEGLQKMP